MQTGARTRADRRVLLGALAALLLVVLLDVLTGAVLVSTLGVVVVVVGLVAAPRQALQVGVVAVLLACLLVALADPDEVAALRVLNVVVGTAVAYVGSAARVRREQRLSELEEREQAAAQQQEAQRQVFAQLQEALLPALPAVPGHVLDLAFLPADPSAPSGGDLHDVQRLPDGTLHVLVADVVGHGVRSTRDALRVVHLARALVLGGTPLPALLGEVDRLLAPVQDDDEEVLATAVALRYDPRDGSLVVADAGHVPPLLVRADGTSCWLEPEGRPVGYPSAGSDGVVRERLGPGDLLVLYTDGLVEADRDLGAGLERLEQAARAAAGTPAQGWAGRLVDAVLGERPRRDDLLVLALRRAPLA